MILAIDTATRWTGLALYDGRGIIAESGWYSSANQTVELAPAVSQMLHKSDIAVSDLSAIAVAIGPGSYTGLRIGLGFAKGLAISNQVLLIGVPTLDILANSLPRSEGLLVAVAEAGRSRICANSYHWSAGKGWLSSQEPVVQSWNELVDQTADSATFAGEVSSAAVRIIKNAKKGFKVVSPAASVRRASFLAEIGWNRLRRGWTDDPDQLSPIYLSDPSMPTTVKNE